MAKSKKIISVEIVNDKTDEVLKALEDMLPTALASIGSEAVTYAMKDCPVDTGNLQNSIAWATSKEKGGGDSVPKATPEENSVYIGTNVEYGVYQEYGDYNHSSGKKHFLRDAMANHTDYYKSVLEAALDT